MACLDVTPPRLLTGTSSYCLLPAYLQLQRLLRIIGSLIGQCSELLVLYFFDLTFLFFKKPFNLQLICKKDLYCSVCTRTRRTCMYT